jgi:arylsulfatase A-like enzyme
MADRPNLLLFLPETVRADAVYGPAGSRARTPNYDRLASEGVAFTQCYAMAAYCTPSRCNMFTGLYSHTNNHRSIWHLLQRGERNLFQDLKEAGYVNVVYGKNDLIDRSWARECFDEVESRVRAHSSRATAGPVPESLRRAMYEGRILESPQHDADWAWVESALQFMDEPHDRPWCIFLPLHHAHPAYMVEEPFFSMHDRSAVAAPLPSTTENRRSYIRFFQEFHGGEAFDEAARREVKATYFGMVSRTDYELGRLLAKLDSTGLARNTIVVAFSDHGDYAGDYGLVEKSCSAFEDCMLRVPLIIRAPEIGPRPPQEALCEMTDLYPTLLELLGIESGHFHFGRSLVPLMRGEVTVHRDAVFAEGGRLEGEESFVIKSIIGTDTYYGRRSELVRRHPEIQAKAAMVRTVRHKYVYCPRDRNELFDLERDPGELRNVAGRPEYAEVEREMRERLMRWMLETADTLPLEQGGRGWK